jgi:hypothetical protein
MQRTDPTTARCRAGRMEEEDGRRRDRRRRRERAGHEAVVKWREELFGIGWGFAERPGRREIFAVLELVDTPMGPLLILSYFKRV